MQGCTSDYFLRQLSTHLRYSCIMPPFLLLSSFPRCSMAWHHSGFTCRIDCRSNNQPHPAWSAIGPWWRPLNYVLFATRMLRLQMSVPRPNGSSLRSCPFERRIRIDRKGSNGESRRSREYLFAAQDGLLRARSHRGRTGRTRQRQARGVCRDGR